MRSSNPVLGRAFGNKRGYAAFEPRSTHALEEMYSAPSATPLQTGRMTMDDVVARTGFLFAILVAVGAAAWFFNVGFGIAMISLLGALGLSLIISFSKNVRPALVVAYAGLEGLAIGAISRFYNDVYPGIVSQAVIGTLAAFVGVLALYRSGKLRATPQFTRILMGALIGYLVLGVASLIASFVGVGGGFGFYGVSGIGLLLAAGGVVLASLFLVLDFNQIEEGVRQGVGEQESWRAAFGLMVTIVWLYLEILRLLAILRRD
ncbi:MAG: Bax inhibitor-1/YccA family protein [Actinobacteria bacterium]|uniref:Bax inhibitor-1/YccA family protein n=1 Tax=Candidatus Fonsibacter lacus TaxID=2576439 RepID=A0A965LKV4_9PROT|nr:Bax inhibitor-1/YccA family protein [Candidatus Fonsibacter lacus]